MEQLGSLPAPETVLNKLKSDGTFDQLRKSCLAAIEEEVRGTTFKHGAETLYHISVSFSLLLELMGSILRSCRDDS